jgi:hypothetical protein
MRHAFLIKITPFKNGGNCEKWYLQKGNHIGVLETPYIFITKKENMLTVAQEVGEGNRPFSLAWIRRKGE